MKRIEAIFKPFKLDEIKEALKKEKLERISLCEVRGAGRQQVYPKRYRGVSYFEDSAEVGIAMIVDDDDAERIAQVLVRALQTGELCDGEVAITPVERLVRVRVGHR
jgi:nitrogen regulatory protein P-II 1